VAKLASIKCSYIAIDAGGTRLRGFESINGTHFTGSGVTVIPSDMAFSYMRTQIMGHYGSEPHHVTELIALTASGRLDLSHSITEIVPLQQAAEALDKLANKVGNPIRIVLKP
jgi:hypothetical protein